MDAHMPAVLAKLLDRPALLAHRKPVAWPRSGSLAAETPPLLSLISKLKFFDVERMPYCGMSGELNGTVELINKKSECKLERIFQASGNSDSGDPSSYESMVALSTEPTTAVE